jgi:hypothetical protein
LEDGGGGVFPEAAEAGGELVIKAGLGAEALDLTGGEAAGVELDAEEAFAVAFAQGLRHGGLAEVEFVADGLVWASFRVEQGDQVFDAIVDAAGPWHGEDHIAESCFSRPVRK